MSTTNSISTIKKINFIVNNDRFEDFVSKLKDLTKISDTIKLKIDKDNFLMYSLVGEVTILAFKNYTINSCDYFKFKEEDFDYTIDFIIPNAKNFVKKLTFFNLETTIKMSLSTKIDSNNESVRIGRSLTVGDERFKINQIGGENYKVRDVSKEQLGKLLSPDNAEWSFEITKNDLSDVKKLASISPDERIINITVNKNKVSFSEGVKWNLNIGNTEEIESADITFSKKYLNSINTPNDYVKFSVFNTFILFNDSESNLMVSFEQSFDENDDK